MNLCRAVKALGIMLLVAGLVWLMCFLIWTCPEIFFFVFVGLVVILMLGGMFMMIYDDLEDC